MPFGYADYRKLRRSAPGYGPMGYEVPDDPLQTDLPPAPEIDFGMPEGPQGFQADLPSPRSFGSPPSAMPPPRVAMPEARRDAQQRYQALVEEGMPEMKPSIGRTAASAGMGFLAGYLGSSPHASTRQAVSPMWGAIQAFNEGPYRKKMEEWRSRVGSLREAADAERESNADDLRRVSTERQLASLDTDIDYKRALSEDARARSVKAEAYEGLERDKMAQRAADTKAKLDAQLMQVPADRRGEFGGRDAVTIQEWKAREMSRAKDLENDRFGDMLDSREYIAEIGNEAAKYRADKSFQAAVMRVRESAARRADTKTRAASIDPNVKAEAEMELGLGAQEARRLNDISRLNRQWNIGSTYGPKSPDELDESAKREYYREKYAVEVGHRKRKQSLAEAYATKTGTEAFRYEPDPGELETRRAAGLDDEGEPPSGSSPAPRPSVPRETISSKQMSRRSIQKGLDNPQWREAFKAKYGTTPTLAAAEERYRRAGYSIID